MNAKLCLWRFGKRGIPGLIGNLLFLICLAGCSSANWEVSRIVNEPEPLPEKERASFGTIGLLQGNARTGMHLDGPAGTMEVTGKVADKTFVKVAEGLHNNDGTHLDSRLLKEAGGYAGAIFFDAIM